MMESDNGVAAGIAGKVRQEDGQLLPFLVAVELAKQIDAALKADREAGAKIADDYQTSQRIENADDGTGLVWQDGTEIAAQIRARGNA